MGTDATTTLTDLVSDFSTWSPQKFEAYQYMDCLDLRATFTSGATQRVLRLYANGDAYFSGSVFLDAGKLAWNDTAVVQNTNSGSDLVSFRTGNGPGIERLRIGSGGDIRSGYEAPLVLKSRRSVVTLNPVRSPGIRLNVENDLNATSANQPLLILDVGTPALGSDPTNRIVSIRGTPSAGPTLTFGDGTNRRDGTIETNTLTLASSGAASVLRLSAPSGQSAKIQAYVNGAQSDATIEANTLTLASSGAASVLRLSAPSGQSAKIQAYVNGAQSDGTIEANTLTLSSSGASAVLRVASASGGASVKVAPASGTEWAVVASTTSTLELRSVTDSVSVVDITYASSVKQLTTEVVKATVRLENAVDSWSNIAGLSPPEGTILLGHNSAVPPTAWRIYAYLNSGWRYVALT